MLVTQTTIVHMTQTGFLSTNTVYLALCTMLYFKQKKMKTTILCLKLKKKEIKK